MNLFWGTHEKRIDKKGRVSVPSAFRSALAAAKADTVVVLPEPKKQFLRAMPPVEFEAIMQQLQQTHGRFTAQRTSASRRLFSRAEPLTFDSEGRIILPAKFLEYANITDTLVFAGGGDHFQIWEPSLLEADEMANEELADDTLADLEALPPEGGLP